MSMRLLGAVCATILASSLSTSLVACTASEKEETVTTAQATSAASVSIDLLDAQGNKVGDASGVLLAPRLVLTTGNAISGKYKWNVTSADGKTKVTGSRGMTYDWMQYDSLKAHPRRHDVGVIHLDAPIKLDAYPRLATGKPASGSEATRVRTNGATFEHIPAIISKNPGAPNNVLTDAKGGETLSPGGAVYNKDGIIGVISGRGMTTGKLYIARTDQIGAWLAPKVSCAGGSAKATYAVNQKGEICDENGNPISGANPGSNPSSNASSNTNEKSNSSSSDTSGSCDGNNDGVCSGNCGGVNKTTPQGDDDDDSATNSSTTGSGGPGGEGGDSSADDGSSGSNPSKGGENANKNKTGGGESHSDATGVTTATRTGGSPSAHSDGEPCQGPSDNPETCPPEPDGCSGSECGGGKLDVFIDYGNCACRGKASDSEYKIH